MFNNWTEEARKVIIEAKKEMQELRHPYIGTEHLVLAILKSNNSVSNQLKEYNVTYKNFKEEIIKVIGVGKKASEFLLYTPLLKKIMKNAMMDSKDYKSDVYIEHLFSALLEEGEGVAIRILICMGVDIDELYDQFGNSFIKENQPHNKRLMLEEYGINLTEKASKGELDPVYGREKEIKRLIEILCRRTKNNPILIGEAGVGKTAIVEELSKRIVNNEVPMQLKNRKIINVDMATLVAGTKYRGEFEDRVKKILKEVEDNEEILLFIDEIHTLVGAGGAEGAIDASNIFKPALARGKIRCIGATTVNEYKKYIEEDGALDRRFQKINIEEPNKEKTREIINNIIPIYEEYHGVMIKPNIVNRIVALTDRYIYDRYQPDKTIDVLDEVCAMVSIKSSRKDLKIKELEKELEIIKKKKNNYILNRKFSEAYKLKEQEMSLSSKVNKLLLNKEKSYKKEVTIDDVAEVIHQKTKIPIYEIIKDNKKIIDNISKKLHQEIIGQEAAIEKLVDITKRIKLGFKDESRCPSLLFVGPSGVGKTELAKIYAKEMAGDDNFIRLDMSEYNEEHTISKILGSPPGYVGYNDHKNILDEVRNKPFSVILLDEIERANSKVMNLFFQILDEGKIRDSVGKIVRFDNTIIIMTSNVGVDQSKLGFNNDDKENHKLKEQFGIPFINRIDSIIEFAKLTEEDIKFIIKRSLQKLVDKYQNINIKIDKKVICELIKEVDYLEYGARKVKQIIRQTVEKIIIDKVMNKEKDIIINSIFQEIN